MLIFRFRKDDLTQKDGEICLRKRLPILLSLLLFAVVFSTGLTASAAVRRTATVNVDKLNVRSGPTLQHSRISLLQRGNVLPVLTEHPGWLQVRLTTGLSGWVAAQYVSVSEKSNLGMTSGTKAIVNTGVLNVRSGAGTTFSRLTTVSRGSLLQVLSRQGDWLQVKLPDGRNGWVAAQHMTIREGAQLTQAVPVTPEPVTRKTDSSAEENLLRVTSSPAASGSVNTVTVNVPILAVVPPANTTERLVYVAVDDSTVWSGPGFETRLVSTLSLGTSLTVVDRQGDWLQVRLSGGEIVWIASWLVATTEIKFQTPTAEALPPKQLTQQPKPELTGTIANTTERLVYVAVDGSTVWSGPGFEKRQISTLSLGTSLTVVDRQGDWLQVRLSGGEIVWIASWLVASDLVKPLTPATNTLAVEQPVKSSPLSGRIVVLDPGHGIDPNRGWATGAVGITGLVEDGLVLDVSLQAAELLRQAGAVVVLTRGDTTVSLRQRVAIAEQALAHVFVSVHANAYFSQNVSGTETFYFRGKPNDAESRWLATCLQAEMLQAFGLPDRGVKHGNFHVIRETTMPAALIEFGFLSNARDEALMRTPQFRSAAASAIFFGLKRFFQLQ